MGIENKQFLLTTMERSRQKSKSKATFCAVSNGHHFGIFTEWIMTSKCVSKYIGCAHQGFAAIEEAAAYVKTTDVSPIMVHTNSGNESIGSVMEHKPSPKINALGDSLF